MMNYELFKEVVTERFMNFMQSEYANYKLDIHAVEKVNETLDSLNLIPDDNENWTPTPSLYLNHMYEHYQECGNLNDVLITAANAMDRAFKNAPEVLPAIDFAKAKENIVMVLINTEQNKELLTKVPNKSFQDLSIIYRWVVDQSKEGVSSTIVTKKVRSTICEMTTPLFLLR